MQSEPEKPQILQFQSQHRGPMVKKIGDPDYAIQKAHHLCDPIHRSTFEDNEKISAALTEVNQAIKFFLSTNAHDVQIGWVPHPDDNDNGCFLVLAHRWAEAPKPAPGEEKPAPGSEVEG